MTERKIPNLQSKAADAQLAGAEVVERFFMLLGERCATDSTLTVEKFARDAGMHTKTLEGWRRGTSPRLDHFARALANLGYALVPLPTSFPRLNKQTPIDYWLPRALEFERTKRAQRLRSPVK